MDANVERRPSFGPDVTTSNLAGSWDRQYEWRAILLLSLGFGLVGLDRWIITPLFPTMMHDLNLNYQDLGTAAGALAIVWGLAAVGIGRLSDMVGRRRIIIPAIVLFSLMSALTGLVTGIVSLVIVRGLMGATEGAYTPACTAAASEAAPAERRGRAQGFVFCAFPLLGLGLGPVIATQLLSVLPSWKYVFYIVAAPGLVLAVFFYRVLRDPPNTADTGPRVRWTVVLRSRNVSVGMVAMICAMSCIFVLGAMVPSYLVDFLRLSPVQMGIVMSALGFGGCLGNFVLPALSDVAGRKATVITAAVIAAVSMYILTRLGPDLISLYLTLFVIAVFSLGIISTIGGPVATEAVSPFMASTAIGLVSGAAELFGGGVAPIIAGFVADKYGIQYVMYVGLTGMIAAVIVSLALVETAPRRR